VANILVTGGAGFMGSWLVDILLDKKHNVINVDDLSGGFRRNINKHSTFYKIDLRNKEKVNKLFLENEIDIVYHLAAYAAEGQSVFTPIAINESITIPMDNLLVASVNTNVKKFIFASSMSVYGTQRLPFNEKYLRSPEDPYGIAKAYCENMLENFYDAHGLNYTIIRPHNVYGPRQNIYDAYRNVLGIWMNRILRGKPPIIYGDGEQKRAFSYVEDSMISFANAGFLKKSDAEIINLGSPEIVTINKACRLVLDAMGSDLEPIYMKGRPQEVKYAYSTTKKSEELLNHKNMHSLKEGLEEMVEWVNKVGCKEPIYGLPLEILKNAPEVWVKKMM
jgi:UDP-glucose 4-epimerase